MLQAIAGSVITVTSLVFSLTVVTLQLASSQFSPRLLRTFLADRGNQVVLGTFLATFAYSLTVLRTIRAGDEASSRFVPEVAVTGAFLLAMASVAALVYFIHHITQEIQVDTMMRDVEHTTRRTIDALHPEPFDPSAPVDSAPAVPTNAAFLAATDSGFVQDVNVGLLRDVAQEHGIVFRLHAGIGEAVVERAPLMWIWCDSGQPPSDEILDSVHGAIFRAVGVGHERTPEGDVAFGLRQLVDIAVRAMSPSLNDPTTAVHAISHLAALCCVLAGRQLSDLTARDDNGVVRVGVARPGFADFLDLACAQIRRFGASEPSVAKALLWMLREVAGAAPPQMGGVVREQAERIAAAADGELAHGYERDQVSLSAAAVERALSGDARPI